MTTLLPYEWLTIDLETIAGRPDSAERWMRQNWSPNNNWKPATVGERYFEMLASKREKLALLDGAPVVCIGLRSESELRCLHSMYAHPPKQAHGALIEGFGSQREMLVALRTLLDARVAAATQIAGHNILQFDLRKLRFAFLQEGLRLPKCLSAHEQATFDTMKEFCNRYSMEGGIMVALDDVLEAFGLPTHKDVVTGADVGKLHAEGKFDLIIQYTILDVLAESDVYKRMTGRSVDEAPRQAPIAQPPSDPQLVSVGAPAVPAAAPEAPPAPKRRKVE